MQVFKILEPKGKKVPILLSVPHCGVHFPEELKEQFIPSKKAQPDDTDWYVHELYDFVLDLGITIIHANYSRWVIDLNRTPDSKPLYNDGRIITALTPTSDFFDEPIYRDENFHPDTEEVNRRLENYYYPYHDKVGEMLAELKNEFGKVLLWDAHSIRRHVPTIQEDPFPDMILGNNEGASCDQKLIQVALSSLRNGPFQINHNHPFKGGYITRSFGKPEENIHALQLEMNKILYMDDAELKFHPGRAERVREVLKSVFTSLVREME